ncbi:hypothetical protein [Niameybacter massiliensis]|uniref:hypothetical protein n=1 Tax=Niameybacter massiliensis TaxID=1658108 RepID=UPI0006B5B563|nr:hypothetical protein [Niameybacter massiliensis]
MKFKRLFLSLFLCLIIFSVSIHASTTSNDAHKQVLETYISKLTQIQKELSSLSDALNAKNSKAKCNIGFNFINKQLDDLLQSMNTYSDSLASNSPDQKEILLLINATNFLKCALLELDAISCNSSSLDTLLILKNYFKFVDLSEQLINTVNESLSSTS